jgi:hypothetical protein
MGDDALSDYFVHSGHDTTARSFKTSEQNPSINLVRSHGNLGSDARNVNGEDQARLYAHEACRTGGCRGGCGIGRGERDGGRRQFHGGSLGKRRRR